jgi:Lrp/AsnC family leucine-responsive transcriptional regulator
VVSVSAVERPSAGLAVHIALRACRIVRIAGCTAKTISGEGVDPGKKRHEIGVDWQKFTDMTVLTMENAKNTGLDRIDRAIIRELQADGRLSNQVLSERVGLSPSPCSRRLKRLEDDGIIRGYTALIDEAAIGFSVSVFVSVKLERQVDDMLNTFEAAIMEFPEVVDCWLMTGTRDYLLRIVTTGLPHYEKFLTSTLTRIPGVASIESSLSLRRVKSAPATPPDGQGRRTGTLPSR